MTPLTATAETEKLAIHGGKPFITTPLPFTPHGRELYGREEEENVLAVLRSKKLNRYELPYEDSFCGRLEMALEKYLGCEHVHVTVSGSVASNAALFACGIGPGDEVIIPTITWQTVPYGIVQAGAVPIIAQVDETLTIDVEDVRRLITPRTKAIIPTHIHGLPSNMDGLMEISKKHNIQIIEDVCQASGGSYKGRRLGTIGDVGYFSMNCMKLMSCGDAGFIATNRNDIYEYCVAYLGAHIFPNHKKKYHLKAPLMPVTQARMNEVTGAIGLAQLGRLEGMMSKMRAAREVVRGEIAGCKSFVPGPYHDPKGDCGIALSLEFPDSDRVNTFLEALRAEGVPMTASRDFMHFQSTVEVGGFVGVCETHQPVMDQRGVWAKYWGALTAKVPSHPLLNPWTHPAYKGGSHEYPPDLMQPSLDKMGKIMFVRMNPRLEPEHGRLIGQAICKVDRLLSRG